MGETRAERRSNLPAELSSFVGRRHELASVRTGVGHAPAGDAARTRRDRQDPAGVPRGGGRRSAAWPTARGSRSWPPCRCPSWCPRPWSGRWASGPPRAAAPPSASSRTCATGSCCWCSTTVEHVQEAAAALAAELLASCPGVRVLVTSRHALALPGELVLTVPPLPLPGPAGPPGSPEALMHYDAVRLFVDRATASWSSFQVTAANQDALAELVRRLDGMPLAIELAAVRVRSLTVEQILDRLSDRFALLTRGSRAALPRQQTLQALLDWSHDLLEPRERLAWARASVFSGGFDLAALEAVACDDDLPAAALPDVVDGLVAKSVLVREPVEIGGCGALPHAGVAARVRRRAAGRGRRRRAVRRAAPPVVRRAGRDRRRRALRPGPGRLVRPAARRPRQPPRGARTAGARPGRRGRGPADGLGAAAPLGHDGPLRRGPGVGGAAAGPAAGAGRRRARRAQRRAGRGPGGRGPAGRPAGADRRRQAAAGGGARGGDGGRGRHLARARPPRVGTGLGLLGRTRRGAAAAGGGAGAAPGGHGPVRRPARAGPARHGARHPG